MHYSGQGCLKDDGSVESAVLGGLGSEGDVHHVGPGGVEDEGKMHLACKDSSFAQTVEIPVLNLHQATSEGGADRGPFAFSCPDTFGSCWCAY